MTTLQNLFSWVLCFLLARHEICSLLTIWTLSESVLFKPESKGCRLLTRCKNSCPAAWVITQSPEPMSCTETILLLVGTRVGQICEASRPPELSPYRFFGWSISSFQALISTLLNISSHLLLPVLPLLLPLGQLHFPCLLECPFFGEIHMPSYRLNKHGFLGMPPRGPFILKV